MKQLIRLFIVVTLPTIGLGGCATNIPYPKDLRDRNLSLTLIINEPDDPTIITDRPFSAAETWALFDQSYIRQEFSQLAVADYRSMLAGILQTKLARFRPKLSFEKVLSTPDFSKLRQIPEASAAPGKTVWDFSTLRARIPTRHVLLADTERWYFSAGAKDNDDKAQERMLGSAELEISFSIVDVATGDQLWHLRLTSYSMVLDTDDLESGDLLSYYTAAAEKIVGQLVTYFESRLKPAAVDKSANN